MTHCDDVDGVYEAFEEFVVVVGTTKCFVAMLLPHYCWTWQEKRRAMKARTASSERSARMLREVRVKVRSGLGAVLRSCRRKRTLPLATALVVGVAVLVAVIEASAAVLVPVGSTHPTWDLPRRQTMALVVE